MSALIKALASLAWTEEELQEWAREYQIQYAPGDPGYARVEDLDWSFDPRFPIRKLIGSQHGTQSVQDWIEWKREEQKQFLHDQGWDRFGEGFEDALEEPITVVLGTDNRYWLWDGFHRVGLAFEKKMQTLPAVVGRPKSSKN